MKCNSIRHIYDEMTAAHGNDSLSYDTVVRRKKDFSTVREVFGHPERSSSSTLSLPSLKRRCHSKSCVRDNVSQSYTCFNVSLTPGTFESCLAQVYDLDTPERKKGKHSTTYSQDD
ncbi:hypothetical protein TNCV_95481 [Trichonephila clavipes]|nr:hypothetical protein TNCV_95481 [Trichonephila clavipes]